MAKYWDPSNDEFNPYNEDSPANPKSQEATDSQDNSSSTDLLRNSENSALSKTGPSFRYSGKGKNTAKTPNKLKGKKKGLGALIICLILTGCGFGFLASSNSLLAPAISALMTEATDTQYTSYTLRSAKLTNLMLKGDSIVSNTWKGSKKYAHMSSSFQKRLANYGIEVEDSGSGRVLKFNGDTIDANDFSKFYNDNIEFRDAFMKAKRGRVATFFDNMAERFYSKLGLSRNLYQNYRQTGDAEADMASYKDTVESRFDGNSSSITTTKQHEEEVKNSQGEVEVDEDGNPKKVTVYDSESVSSTTQAGTLQADAEVKMSSELERISGEVSQVLNWGCTAFRVGNMVSTMAAALEIYQSINYFMSNVENISKMMSGDGDASAINSFLNFMTTSSTSTIEDYNNTSFSGSVSSQNLSIEVGKTEETGTPLEAQGMQSMLAYAPIDTKKTANYSLERTTKTITAALVTSNVTFASCAVAQGVTAAFSLAINLTPAGLVNAFGGFALKLGLGLTISASISVFLRFLIPVLVQSSATNLAENITGIPAGEKFAQGASATNQRLGMSGSGQSGSSEQAVRAYNSATQQVLAMDAEADRLNHSPLDITNKNTFLGSIAYSLLPATLSNSTTTNLGSLMRTTSSSLATLTNKTYASNGVAGGTFFDPNNFGNCPNLESVGMVGDAYCNPIMSTDMSTINLDPNDTRYAEVMDENMECHDDGNCTIKDDSDLAKKINFCDRRESPFGIPDANILSSLESGGAVVGAIPVVSDVVDIINSFEDMNNYGWATGEKCGNTEQNSEFWNSTMKYLQRYTEDNRILAQMGAYEDSTDPVTAYIEKYDAEHPVDNSPSGYLARISGSTKEEAQLMLDIIAYYNFLNNYDPTSRIAMDRDTTTPKNGEEVALEIQDSKLYIKTQKAPEKVILATNYTIYADIRNRSYAV